MCTAVRRLTRKGAERNGVLVAGAISPVVKQPMHKANHSPSYIVQVKNNWSCNSPASYGFISYTRDNFAFVLISILHY